MNLFIHLLIYNLIISVLLYASLAYNPRMWMHRMPPEVVQKVSPRTPAEKRQLYYFGVPFLLMLAIYPIVYVLLQQTAGYLDKFLIFGAFFAGFTVWDTLVLDLLIFCKFTPGFVVIPGTTCQDYANMKYHLVSGAKGLIISVVFSAVLAAFL